MEAKHLLSKFHLDHKKQRVILITGCKRSGKTQLGIEILRRCRFKRGLVITDDIVKDYDNICPYSIVQRYEEPRQLDTFVTYAKYVKEWCFIFLDNVSDNKLYKSKSFENLIKNGRHNNILVVISINDTYVFRPFIRSHVSVIFQLPGMPTDKQKNLWYRFDTAYHSISFKDYEKIYRLVSGRSKYSSLVIDNTSRSRAGSIRYHDGTNYKLLLYRIIRKVMVRNRMNKMGLFPKEINKIIVKMI